MPGRVADQTERMLMTPIKTAKTADRRTNINQTG